MDTIDATYEVGETIVVTNTAELNAAVNALLQGGGGTIALDGAGGPYDIMLDRVGGADTPITFTALDPDMPPQVHQINVMRSSHFSFTGLTIENPDPEYSKYVQIVGSNNVTFSDNIMKGNAEGFWSESGDCVIGKGAIFLQNTDNVTISNNQISHFMTAVGALDSTNLTVSGNELSALQGDGFRGGGLLNATITDNYMHDFFGSTQSLNHSDMIQLWGSGTARPNENIVISGNMLDAGAGTATEGIFIRNEEINRDTPASGYFQNITITDNVVHNGMRHGISASNIEGLTVSNNTVLWNQNVVTRSSADAAPSSDVPWISINDAPGAVATGNIAPNVSVYECDGVDGAASKAENTVLSYSDPSSTTYVHDLFINAGDGYEDARDLMLRPDAPMYGTAGAAASSTMTFDAPLTPMIAPSMQDGHRLGVRLQAFGAAADGSVLDSAGLQATWTFADGSTRTGLDVAHAFDAPGSHEVQLTLTDTTGNSTTLTRTVIVDDPVLLDLDFDGGGDASGWNTSTALRDPNGTAIVDSGDGNKAFHLTGGNSFVFDESNVHLFNLDRFEIAFDLTMDTGRETGGLVYQHTIMKADVTATGALRFNLRTDAGSFTVVSEDGAMWNTDPHRITLRYDDSIGKLEILDNGVVLAEGTAHGTTASPTPWGLGINGGWHAAANAVFDNFTVRQQPAATYIVPEPARPATIEGTTGDDVMIGTDDADIINAGAGDDDITATPGDDRIDGGAGIDTVHYDDEFGTFLVDAANGKVTSDMSGTDTLNDVETLRFLDGRFDMNAGTFDRNDAAIVTDDTFKTDPDTAIILDHATLLADDVDPEGETLQVSGFSTPANGQLTTDPATGATVYRPDPGFTGVEELQYTVTDSYGLDSTGTVSIRVGDPTRAEILEAAFDTGDAVSYRVAPDAMPDSYKIAGRGVEVTPDGITMDGSGHLSLGRLPQFENAPSLGMSITFSQNQPTNDTVRLIWNHTNFGLEVVGDDIKMFVGTATGKFTQTITGFGLKDTDSHNIKLWIDQDEDTIQMSVDGTEEVINTTDADLEWIGGGEYGWALGGAWGRLLNGTIEDFMIAELDADTIERMYSYDVSYDEDDLNETEFAYGLQDFYGT